MKSIVIIILMMVLIATVLFAEEPSNSEKELLDNQEKMLENQEKIINEVYKKKGFAERKILNVMSSPTAYTLKKNEFIIGVGSIYYGVLDNVQIGTNLLYFLIKDRNMNLKFNFYNSSKVSIGSAIYLDSFSSEVNKYDDDDDGYYEEKDENFTSVAPSLAISFPINQKVSWHISGQYNAILSGNNEDFENVMAGVFSKGSRNAIGFEYSASNRTKIVTEAIYDYTLEGFRAGGAFVWGWNSFRLKLGLISFKYRNTESYYYPHINFWWRFNG
ncbi:MAG: hypothetical protein K8S23_02255 [Candidatus Cloacimonetes bacterium]|nr:hypothetical protein [Candidatus Cloacimonadota bacterium]